MQHVGPTSARAASLGAFTVLLAATAFLGGCAANAGAGSAGFTPSFAAHTSTSHRAGLPPPNAPCPTPPTVWASAPFSDLVYGLSGPNSVPICSIGTTPTPPFILNTPISLATDGNGNLYVADLNNDRIVVYKKDGTYLSEFSTGGYQPQGVCVSPTGIVGVANRAYNQVGQTNVEFFSAGVMIGMANDPTLQSASYCAFDQAGDFFVDGTSTSPPGNAQIWYVARAYLTSMNAPLVLSNAGSGTYWLGMFSRIGPIGYSLSAAGPAHTGGGCATRCAPLVTWLINGNHIPPATGPITFSGKTLCTLTNFPNGANAVNQVAPSAFGQLYVADYGDYRIETAPQCNMNPIGQQPLSTYEQLTLHNLTGVATYPTGQF